MHSRSSQSEAIGFRTEWLVRELFMNCGKLAHSSIDLSRLAALGQALDSLQTLSVFSGGLVGFPDETESEVIKYVAGKEGRSAARPRPGQRAAQRTWRRTPGEADAFRSGPLEEAFGAGFRILAQHYEALAFEDPNGLWVAVTSNPLGHCGPQIHFLIMLPVKEAVRVRAWAFHSIGSNAKFMPQKHTNFPDASICAFPPDKGFWCRSDGLLALVDHYTVWAVKSLHRKYLGSWPGHQVGPSAFYRRKEFKSGEFCGCGSGVRYGLCHQASDLLIDDVKGRRDFSAMYQCNYEDRSPPPQIVRAARTRWKWMPAVSELGF